MDRMIPIWFLPILICLIFPVSNSEELDVRLSLVQFMEKLSAGGNVQQDPKWGWNNNSDPCVDNWTGVFCDSNLHVRRIVLEDYNLSGTFDASSVCLAKSLNILSLNRNNITGSVPEGIGNCKQLTHLYIGRNKLSGEVPDSLSELRRLKRLDLSYNGFSGQVSFLSRIVGLLTFLVENNQLSGPIPDFDFSQLEYFNVSNNNFTGPVPDTKGKFKADSYSDNPGLCGELVSNACPPSNPPSESDSGHSSRNGVLIYSGYFILALILLLFVALKVMGKKKPKEAKTDAKTVSAETSTKPSSTSDEFRTTRNRSEYSISSVEVGTVSSSLIALGSPLGKGLKFEDLLRAPAELLGKGKHGSLYKVLHNDGLILTVKRIKDWSISNEDFKRRMERLDQVKHPRSLPALAYYCSKQEKLLVYEYQQNGSLFKLQHGSQSGQVFDWESRLSVAAIIAETVAFLHQEFAEDGIAHGNLKSTNILFNKKMEPCISEYGLMVEQNQDQPFITESNGYKLDVYSYGVILLELLTGKLVQNSGIDLGKWVHSVVREEWTAEVFDKALISEGASEERMVNLLQVALKCINPSPNQRPNISQVAHMINSIKEEEEKSVVSETSFSIS